MNRTTTGRKSRGLKNNGGLAAELAAVAILYSFFVDYYVSSLTGAVKE